MHKKKTKNSGKPVPETAKFPQQREQYGLHFSSSLKIVDTGTGKIILKMRCD